MQVPLRFDLQSLFTSILSTSLPVLTFSFAARHDEILFFGLVRTTVQAVSTGLSRSAQHWTHAQTGAGCASTSAAGHIAAQQTAAYARRTTADAHAHSRAQLQARCGGLIGDGSNGGGGR